MSPSITRAEAAALGRRLRSRQGQPVKALGELLAIFVPGKFVNPLNANAWGWQKRSRLAKQWKLAVANALFEIAVCHVKGIRLPGIVPGLVDYRLAVKMPKRVTFLANTHNVMDTDGLQAALKPVRDALVECGVIHSDAPDSGHEFVYEQQIDRVHRGVTIRVALKTPAPAKETP